MKRYGFTLIEVLIVVIIIGVLATIGIPQYAASLEKAKGGEAKEGLSYIYRAELEYAAFRTGVYTNSIADLGDDIALTRGHWNFSIVMPTSTSFTAIATRTSGSHSGQTITLDNLGNLSGNWEFR